jgi:hypothetical protein
VVTLAELSKQISQGLTRLEVVLYTEAQRFAGHTHEQFADLFHEIDSDRARKLAPLTTRYTRVAHTRKRRRIIDEGTRTSCVGGNQSRLCGARESAREESNAKGVFKSSARGP